MKYDIIANFLPLMDRASVSCAFSNAKTNSTTSTAQLSFNFILSTLKDGMKKKEEKSSVNI